MTATMQDEFDRMLTRLKLTAVRDQLDSLLDEAARSELTLRDALAFFCAREIARKDQRRIDMSFGLAKFPFVRTLDGFDFTAQPSIDKAQVRDRAVRGSLKQTTEGGGRRKEKTMQGSRARYVAATLRLPCCLPTAPRCWRATATCLRARP